MLFFFVKGLSFQFHSFYRDHFLFARLKIKALKDILVPFHNTFAGKAHFLVRIGMIAAEGQSFFDGLVDDDGQTGFIGVAELFVETADHLLRTLDQVVVVDDQVARGGMCVYILKRVMIPVSCHLEDLINVQVTIVGSGKLVAGVIDPGNCGGQHVERVAGEVQDARIGEEFRQCFDLGAEGRVLCHKIFFTGGIHVPLEHGPVEGHNAFFVFRAERCIEMNVIGELIHEWEKEGDEVAVPNMHVDVFILFRLKERDGMYLYLAKCGAVEGEQGAMQASAKVFIIESCNELGDLFLRDRRREIDIPCGQAGEGFCVARKQAM